MPIKSQWLASYAHVGRYLPRLTCSNLPHVAVWQDFVRELLSHWQGDCPAPNGLDIILSTKKLKKPFVEFVPVVFGSPKLGRSHFSIFSYPLPKTWKTRSHKCSNTFLVLDNRQQALQALQAEMWYVCRTWYHILYAICKRFFLLECLAVDQKQF